MPGETSALLERCQLIAALEQGLAELGHVDIVVAQAGIAAMRGDPPLQAWADVLDTNLLGTINAIHVALPHLGEGASVIAHNNVLGRMSGALGKAAAMPQDAWPTDTYVGDEKKLWFNDEGVEIIHVPSAHTDGDSIVYFRKSDVISTGDLFVTTSYPIIDVAAGGTINGYLDGLQKIVDLIVPVYGQEGGTLVIPGHGRLCDLGDVLNYREMATIIRDRVQDMIKKGMTLEQVKAAKPTFDYDPLYGTSTGFWTTDRFVEAVYQTLLPNKERGDGKK